MDTNLLIRTFIYGDGWLNFSVGGGIVADSSPEKEYAETWHKAEGLLRCAARLMVRLRLAFAGHAPNAKRGPERARLMILEGIVTTISAAGEMNIAPMGPRVDADMRRFLLRPFNTAQTYRNLRDHPEGVLHVTDDVLMLAKAALGKLEVMPALTPVRKVRGWVLADACRFYEFRVLGMDDGQERVSIDAEVVHRETLREFFGFNRAKHAVVEAAILATRIGILPLAEIEADFRKLAVIVHKTGGSQETEAFAFLQDNLAQARANG